MEIFLIRLLQFFLAIGLLVLLHEGGHFFFAKLFGIRVEKFYLFFDMTVGKWSGKLFSIKPKNSDTEYGVGWIPLGGYCKIAGMIDESFDTEQMKQPEQPWEFRTKPAWQRLLVMIGGVLVNFLLALFIYSMVLFTWGRTYIPLKNMTEGMKFNEEAKSYGFRDGDILIGSDGVAFVDWGADLFRQLATAKDVEVLRSGEAVHIALPGDLNLLDMLKNSPRFVEVRSPLCIDSIMPGTAADKCGLKPGDKIIALSGHRVEDYNDFVFEMGRQRDMMAAATTAADSMKARMVDICVVHEGDTVKKDVVLSEELALGFYNRNVLSDYAPVTREYGFFESFPAGIAYGWNVLRGYVGDMRYLFSADGAKSLGGFAAIGSLFPATWDWHRFWEMTAFLSIILAFMNILPIPALDGGHVLFLLYEMIVRRKPSDQFMVRAEYVGFGLVILLLVVANLNDILRFLGYL